MRLPWKRDKDRPDVDRALDEALAKLDQAVVELNRTVAAMRRERDR